jgi:DNA ligase-1
MQFDKIVAAYELISATSKRTEMADVISNLVVPNKSEVRRIIYLLQGKIEMDINNVNLNISNATIQEVLENIANKQLNYNDYGDIGLMAKSVIEKLENRVEVPINISDIFDTAKSLSLISGKNSVSNKIAIIGRLFKCVSPESAKYIAKLFGGHLRLGIGESTIIDGVINSVITDKKMKKKIKAIIEDKYGIRNDLGYILSVFINEGIEAVNNIHMELFTPISPMLANRAKSAEDGFNIMYKTGYCLQPKYDGLRAQVHYSRKQNRIEIYSRGLNRLTDMFPEICNEKFDELIEDVIFEGEIISYNQDTMEYYPFQDIMTRKRKKDIKEKMQNVPAYLFAFDVMYINGSDATKLSYSNRLNILDGVIRRSKFNNIIYTPTTFNPSKNEVEYLFNDYISKGLEGILLKNILSPYLPDKRTDDWLKLKRSYSGSMNDTVDVVVVGYKYGSGERVGKIGSLMCAIYNKEKEKYQTICLAGSGLSDYDIEYYKNYFNDLQGISNNCDFKTTPDVYVEPNLVLEILCDEITISPSHSSGYALRFPRIKQIRKDKNINQITTYDEIVNMYNQQSRNNKTSD